MDWYHPQEFHVGSLYVNMQSDEVVEFIGASEIDGLPELGVSPHALVFRCVNGDALRLATELGYRRGENFRAFIDEGVGEA